MGEKIGFIGVGRMVEKKGFDDTIAAFAAMIAEPNAPKAALTIIGDGPLRQQLEAQAAQLKQSGAIRFTGLLPHAEVAKTLSEAHVFVLASKTAANGDMEGIPVALMEAMAQGMPVLATIHSGTPELVEHGVSGFLNDEGDWRTLSANMRQLAETSERWAQMGAAGAAKVRAEFDLKLWNDRLLERLTQLWGSVTTASARANTSP